MTRNPIYTNYVIQALRTEAPPENIRIGNPRITHAILGVVTEVGEILLADSAVNLREEVGDVAWYGAILVDELQITIDDLLNIGASASAADMVADPSDPKLLLREAIAISDLLKREMIYGIPLDIEKLLKAVGQIFYGLNGEIPLTDAMGANLRKLQRRYQEKFTTEEAQHRDLDAELEELKT